MALHASSQVSLVATCFVLQKWGMGTARTAQGEGGRYGTLLRTSNKPA
jgi:hypothetical protein